MDDLPTPAKRPIVVTVFCVIGVIGSVSIAWRLLFPGQQFVPRWYPFYLIGGCIIGWLCLIGLWKMKRWAFYLYVTVALANVIAMGITGWWALQPIIVGAITIGILAC